MSPAPSIGVLPPRLGCGPASRRASRLAINTAHPQSEVESLPIWDKHTSCHLGRVYVCVCMSLGLVGPVALSLSRPSRPPHPRLKWAPLESPQIFVWLPSPHSSQDRIGQTDSGPLKQQAVYPNPGSQPLPALIENICKQANARSKSPIRGATEQEQPARPVTGKRSRLNFPAGGRGG